MVTTIPITKARINLGDIVKRARIKKEYFILEKDGYPVAGIMNIDDFEDYLEINDGETKKQINKSHSDYKKGNSCPISNLLNK
jgi:hypothetical protein